MGGGLQVLLGGFAFWLLSPVFLAVHELGHAAVPLARTDGRVEIQLGRPPIRWRFSAGRIDFAVNPVAPITGSNGGLTRPLGRLGPYSRIACVLAGPLASGAFSAGVTYLGLALNLTAIVVMGAWGLLMSAYALVPRRAGSDGTNLLRALQRARTEPKVERQRRWLELFRDVKGTLGPERGRVLNAVPILVGHPGKGPDAIGVWKLAFAGWCWRAASGDAWQTMRSAALDALQEAARTWTTEPDVTIVATQTLVSHESPDGLEHMPASLRAIPVDEARQRWAFQFGIALYDLDMARNASSTS